MPKVVDREARRTEIVAAAARSISRLGVERATIREISEESGHSVGVLMHYFENREDLLLATFHWVDRRGVQRFVDHLDRATGLSGLRHALEAGLPTSDETRLEWRVRMNFWGQTAVAPAYADAAATFGATRDRIVAHLCAARDEGEIRPGIDLTPAADGLLALVVGLSVNSLLDPGQYDTRCLCAAIREHLSHFEGPPVL